MGQLILECGFWISIRSPFFFRHQAGDLENIVKAGDYGEEDDDDVGGRQEDRVAGDGGKHDERHGDNLHERAEFSKK